MVLNYGCWFGLASRSHACRKSGDEESTAPSSLSIDLMDDKRLTWHLCEDVEDSSFMVGEGVGGTRDGHGT